MLKNLIGMSNHFLKKNGSTVLAIVGALGVIGTAIMAVKATPKAMDLLKEAEEEKGDKLTVLEKVVAATPVYIPAVLVGFGTITCVIGSHILTRRQQTAITGAYIILNKSFAKYKQKVIEIYGQETDDHIQSEISNDIIKAEKMCISAPSIFGGARGLEKLCSSDRALFYDVLSERYFESTPLDVYAAEYNLSRNFILGGATTPNDFYDFLGIDHTEDGDTIGWSMESGYAWLDFDHIESVTDDGLVCYLISPVFTPDAEYDTDYTYRYVNY